MIPSKATTETQDEIKAQESVGVIMSEDFSKEEPEEIQEMGLLELIKSEEASVEDD